MSLFFTTTDARQFSAGTRTFAASTECDHVDAWHSAVTTPQRSLQPGKRTWRSPLHWVSALTARHHTERALRKLALSPRRELSQWEDDDTIAG